MVSFDYFAGTSKSRSVEPTLLLKRTTEDRERIITEKVAIVLINEEESAVLDPFLERKPSVKSKKLFKFWIEVCALSK